MNKIIVFDGDCIFCNRFINYVVEHDNGTFRLLDRNSESFKAIRHQFGIDEPSGESIYVLKGDKCLGKSSAVRYILLHCGGMAKVAAGFMFLCPPLIRNFVYDIIARNRKKISARYCRIPGPAFMARMLK